jgi:predicted metal-dependent peptidase
MSAAANTTQNKDNQKKFEDLLGPTDPAVDRVVRDALVTARVGLLLKASWFGNMATRLTLVNADEWCSTAATDGRRFYYNTRFIQLLRPREIEFLFGHEVLHCVYDHFGRRMDRLPLPWNIANDFAVNGDLKKHGVGEFITSVPCLYDAKYDGLSSEEIYDQLMAAASRINLDDLAKKILDQHMDGDGEGEGDGEQGGGQRPRLSEEEKAAIRDEIKEAMIAAAAACENPGNIPAGVRRMIQELTEPKMNWREMLRMQLESTIKSDFSWMRASRRGWHMDAIMPGMKNDEMIDIMVFLDASGSISGAMLRDFLSEVGGIMDQFTSYRVHVATFDTAVYNPQVYTSDNINNIAEYEIGGGGGTDFECMFSWMRNSEIEPKRLLVFTDGYPFGSWGDENYADTVWIIHGTESIVPPWGQHAYYSEAE